MLIEIVMALGLVTQSAPAEALEIKPVSYQTRYRRELKGARKCLVTAKQADKYLADLMKRFKRIQRLPHKVGNERRRVRASYGNYAAWHRRLAECMDTYFPEPKP